MVKISEAELKFFIKLLSSTPDKGWYNIRVVKNGIPNENLVSVTASRLNRNKGLLEKGFNNQYRPTVEGWQALKEHYEKFALPLAKIIDQHFTPSEI